jgi:hypothetical protein
MWHNMYMLSHVTNRNKAVVTRVVRAGLLYHQKDATLELLPGCCCFDNLCIVLPAL